MERMFYPRFLLFLSVLVRVNCFRLKWQQDGKLEFTETLYKPVNLLR